MKSSNKWGDCAGDVLVVNENPAGLYAVHWDGGRFVIRQLPVNPGVTWLEHTTFAPIELPAVP